MKKLLQAEELLQLLIAIYALTLLPVQLSWWLWLLLFFAPDLSMVGYLVNNRWGAAFYHVVHDKGTAAVLLLAGTFLQQPSLQTAGILLWAHSSFDRVLGYGLKFGDSFQHTHLGFIGKGK
jgi:hypothetical protein